MGSLLSTFLTIIFAAVGKWITDWLSAGQRDKQQQEVGVLKYENAAIDAKQQRTEAAKNTMDSLIGLTPAQLADRMRITQSRYKNRPKQDT